ncbi:hypothetical protein RB195_020773 [Necator americanus]|uniref:Uncharacterized protein n=2 Tax=Necator americanus TaxID=51031 RepID=W2T5G9_NECAM|nr:hypothetical protein NECAME_11675 [Necator americanus]ETN76436.1 hypothetical protein NECAME_11675 [Necator americanus]
MLTSALTTLTALSTAILAAPIAERSFVEQPDGMSNGTMYSISDFSPKVFVRTDEFELNFKSCIEFNYKLLKNKVRLRAYTCLLSEGGFCTLDKYSYPKDNEGCAYLRPWLYPFDRYSFYFVLERRQRKYNDPKKRGRRVSRKTGRLSATPFGHLQLIGVVPCEEVCGKKNKENRTG